MAYVKAHTRKLKNGKLARVKGHFRFRKIVFKDVPEQLAGWTGRGMETPSNATVGRKIWEGDTSVGYILKTYPLSVSNKSHPLMYRWHVRIPNPEKGTYDFKYFATLKEAKEWVRKHIKRG